MLEDQDEDIESFWSLLELNPFAVQFRYELAGEDFPHFDRLAQTAKQLAQSRPVSAHDRLTNVASPARP